MGGAEDAEWKSQKTRFCRFAILLLAMVSIKPEQTFTWTAVADTFCLKKVIHCYTASQDSVIMVICSARPVKLMWDTGNGTMSLPNILI